MSIYNHKMMWFALFAVVLYQISSSLWKTENVHKDKVGRKYSKEDEVRMLLIGKTGVGKSTTGNTILGFPAFDNKASATSVTSKTQCNEMERFGKKLVVIDTPGFFDTDRSNKDVLVEVSKWYALASPGLHAIILVVQVGRFTEEEKKTVSLCMKAFGEELKQYLIIVFTRTDQLDDDNTLDDFIRTLDDKSNLKYLIDETKGRYTAIGYKGQQSEREKEVRHILSMIDNMEKTNGGSYYSNDIMKEVEHIMEEKDRKIVEEAIKEKENKYTSEEVAMLLSAARSHARAQIINESQNEDFFSMIIYIVRAKLLALFSSVISPD